MKRAANPTEDPGLFFSRRSAVFVLPRDHPARILGRQHARGIELRNMHGGEPHIACGEVVCELVPRFCSNDDAGDEGPRQEPRKGDPRNRQAGFRGNRPHRLEHGLRALAIGRASCRERVFVGV